MNDLIKVRKIVTHVENIFHEGGPVSKIPIKKGAVLIVLENPYAGQYVSKIIPMMDALKPIGLDAANKLNEEYGIIIVMRISFFIMTFLFVVEFELPQTPLPVAY